MGSIATFDALQKKTVLTLTRTTFLWGENLKQNKILNRVVRVCCST